MSTFSRRDQTKPAVCTRSGAGAKVDTRVSNSEMSMSCPPLSLASRSISAHTTVPQATVPAWKDAW